MDIFVVAIPRQQAFAMRHIAVVVFAFVAGVNCDPYHVNSKPLVRNNFLQQILASEEVPLEVRFCPSSDIHLSVFEWDM